MNAIDIAIVDNNQLIELREKYPQGEEIQKDGNKYYQICNAIIAELPNNNPQDTDSIILDDIIYSSYLLNRGYEKIAEHGVTESFEGEIEPTTTFEYKRDYFLGDIVMVRNEYDIEKKVRITEIIEAKDETGYKIEPKFEYME